MSDDHHENLRAALVALEFTAKQIARALGLEGLAAAPEEPPGPDPTALPEGVVGDRNQFLRLRDAGGAFVVWELLVDAPEIPCRPPRSVGRLRTGSCRCRG